MLRSLVGSEMCIRDRLEKELQLVSETAFEAQREALGCGIDQLATKSNTEHMLRAQIDQLQNKLADLSQSSNNTQQQQERTSYKASLHHHQTQIQHLEYELEQYQHALHEV
eukprot:TRINITY_DN1486_c0_g1_i17.p4 TRINITY_DN1486_c0_g1~~TRINITY_DN1486_c0_g1_i17.p4  ORF type:complete len:111 (+),score=39.35 TRINITY_DN1486_c0_g1_i17:160-492(+)